MSLSTSPSTPRSRQSAARLRPRQAARAPGVEFRPNVIRHAASGAFLMWYEDRHENQTGYAVAVADGPAGPFRTVVDDAAMDVRGARRWGVEGTTQPRAGLATAIRTVTQANRMVLFPTDDDR